MESGSGDLGRTELGALLDALASGRFFDGRLRAARRLAQAQLDQRVVFEMHWPHLWRSRNQTALDVLADLATDPVQAETTRILARSVLGQHAHLLALLQRDERHLPLVYELLLQTNARVYFDVAHQELTLSVAA